MLQTKANKKKFLVACMFWTSGRSECLFWGVFSDKKNKKIFLLQYAFLCFNVLFSDLSDKDILMC
jgi:hypothetical protein